MEQKNDYGKQRPPRKPHLASGAPHHFFCHLCCQLHHHSCDAGSLRAAGFSTDLDVLGVTRIGDHLFHALELRRRTLQHVTFSRAARNACAAPPCSSPGRAGSSRPSYLKYVLAFTMVRSVYAVTLPGYTSGSPVFSNWTAVCVTLCKHNSQQINRLLALLEYPD